MHVCVCVHVCVGNPNYNGHFYSFQNVDMSSFESAGGARDACWTGTNEDASIASVKRVRTLTRVPAKRLSHTQSYKPCIGSSYK